jgi:hypothetical protein
MKRSSILLTLAIALAPICGSGESVTVVLNGRTVNFTQPPIVRTGRVFVPLRGVFEQLGASVVYANGQINATRHGRTISLSIGSTQATVADEPAVLDVAPFIVGDTTFVPLRFISQALGASVSWNDSTSTVTIDSGAPAMPPPPPEQRPPPPPHAVHFVTVWPSGTIYNVSPTLRFQFDRAVTLAAFRVTVDGRNITSAVRQNGPNFAIALPWPLDQGVHRVRVTGTTAAGAPFDLSWSFIRG